MKTTLANVFLTGKIRVGFIKSLVCFALTSVISIEWNNITESTAFTWPLNHINTCTLDKTQLSERHCWDFITY